MTVGTAPLQVFDADLPTLHYTLDETPAEVYPRLQAAQQQAPVAIGPIGPEVLSYHLVRSVLRDSRFQVPPGIVLQAQGVTSGPLWDKVINSMLCVEGETHRRLRGLCSKAFTPRTVARLHDVMSDVMNDLVDDVAGAGRCDVVADLARPYPVPIICALLGAPREDWQQFSLWADEIFQAFSIAADIRQIEPAVMQAWRELDDYVDDMVAHRRHTLTDDLLSDLIRAEDDGDRLDAAELKCSPAGCCSRGPTPPAIKWLRRYKCSASIRISGSCSAGIRTWRCRRWKKRCAIRRSRAELCASWSTTPNSAAISFRRAPWCWSTPRRPIATRPSTTTRIAST